MSNNIQEITDREAMKNIQSNEDRIFIDALTRAVEEVGQVQFESVVPMHGALQESDLREVMASVNSQTIVSGRTYQPIYELGSSRPVTWIMSPPRHVDVGNPFLPDARSTNPNVPISGTVRSVGAEPIPDRTELVETLIVMPIALELLWVDSKLSLLLFMRETIWDGIQYGCMKKLAEEKLVEN